jgi:Fe2+ or Zn2+ uptake regulation protein
LTSPSFRLSLNSMQALLDILRQNGIQPTPQRLEVAKYVLEAENHPSADQVLEVVLRRCPTISRATVYNTLNLLVDKGLLAARTLREGAVVFDPCIKPHHHLIDTETGQIHDIPWEALDVQGATSCEGFDVQDYQVVLRGRKK